MSRISDRMTAFAAQVDSIIESINSGEDSKESIRRLHESVPWVTVALGLDAVQDAIELSEEADAEFE